MKIELIGSSKVGRTFAVVLRRNGHVATVRALRRRLPSKPFEAPLLLLTVRDTEIVRLAEELAERSLVSKRTVVLHVAGAVGPEALERLRGVAAGVGQAHPLLSFAASDAPPTLSGAHLLVAGDAVAVRRARTLARYLGMVPRNWQRVDPVLYHAAAGLLANGAVTLAATAAQLLAHAGAPPSEIDVALGPLLRSVAENTSHVGLPAALTGPVRRGDVEAVSKHLLVLRRVDSRIAALYASLVAAQLPLARALADAGSKELAQIERLTHGKLPRRARKG